MATDNRTAFLKIRDLRVILAAGGSGGHIFPSVAVASELEKMGVEQIYFVSSKRRLDKNIHSSTKHKCFFLSANPMPLRADVIKMLVFMIKLLKDSLASFRIILETRPHVVLGFGGYSSGTILRMANLFRIPVIIHEQNYVPGRANKILGRIADRIAVSFSGSAEYFASAKHRVVFTGNPIRLDRLSMNREKSARELDIETDKMTVLVMGGSQGSTFLNTTVSKAARYITEKMGDKVQFIHLTGAKDYADVKQYYEKHGIPGKVFSFLKRIDCAYAASDLAVSRSGAAAVFELAYYAKPMILIPYPHPKNNQRSNAAYFSEKGAAIYREEDELTVHNLADEVLEILSDNEKRARLSKAAGMLSFPDADRLLAGEVVKLAGAELPPGYNGPDGIVR
ncbi:MAG: undecaprenyldiphospho-muramoylpentapeptide beta-N-acetylglucosaminyltransferase [Candidatus Omnitrophota bacterium]